MSLDHILLGMIESGDACSGYDVKSRFDEGARHYWYAELSQIYPTLRRLEERGLVRSSLGPSSRGPERRVYTTTEDGRAELAAWLRSGPHMGKERFAYIAQMLFMGVLDDFRETERFLEGIRQTWVAKVAFLRDVEGRIDRDIDTKEGPGNSRFHQQAGLRLGIAMLDAKITWADATLSAVRARLGAAATAEV